MNSDHMTMVITVVPPVGPPVPTITGKAIRFSPNSKYEVYLLKSLEKGNKLLINQSIRKMFCFIF